MAENILETIGNTPIVRINRLNPNPNVTIYAKLEGFNPNRQHQGPHRTEHDRAGRKRGHADQRQDDY